MTAMVAVYEQYVIQCPESALERKFIADYLLGRGYKMSDLAALPEHEACRLMKEACQYAALRLAEIEARSSFCRKIGVPC